MRSTFTVLLLVLGSSLVQASPVTVLRQDYVYDVAPDGTWTVDTMAVRRIEETQAIGPAGQVPVQYSESLQSVEILEAYSTTKDGTRIDVPADKIITQQLPASAGAPTFSDEKVKMVVFPQVEVGTTLTLHYRLKQLKPFLPGVFSMAVSFNIFLDTQTASVTLRAPEKLKLYISSRDVQGGEVKSSVPGKREWHWTYGEAKGTQPEPGSMMPETFSPYAAASTLQSYPELAKAYMIGADPAAKVTPAVQKLAEEITSGVTDKRAQADALYRWVSTQIRYVAIVMGAGGYVPHQADEIIAARYGDCKDKTTLLTALLHARGIRAMPVLIHTGDTYKLPDSALLSAFNHAITYLPEWDLFVDSTSGFAQFGTLATALAGKQALLGGDKSMQPGVRQTPVLNAARDRLVLHTNAALTADGSVSGKNVIEALGAMEPIIRGSLGAITEAMRPAVAQRLLSSSGQTGEATLTISDARDLTTPFSFSFEFKTPMRVNMPGPGALATSFGMPLPSGAQAFAGQILQLERKLDFPCAGGSTEEQLELALPAGLKITSLPGASNLESPYGRFTASYEVKDQKLLIDRKLDFFPSKQVCTAADSVELRKFATAISQQMRAQVLYQ